MNATASETLMLENKLRRALELERCELYYQPKLSLSSGKIVGVEALIRWNDPDHGIVAPARFIPLLEETGLIAPVGRWALRRALEDYQNWRGTVNTLPRIAVNVSAVQLAQHDFVDMIR
jgi:EAL domain-containing protein (putative c-di-GMP-specific phosphodiesterase class I)